MATASIPAPKPLKLDGDVAEHWKRWRKSFEIYMTATEKDKKTEKIQCATFLSLAGEAAIALYETFSFEEDEEDKIAPLIAKFEAFCIPKRNVTHERHVLNARKQKADEPIEQFVTELRRLIKNCEYGELTDSILKDRIVEGIYNDTTRERLLRERDLTLVKCLDIRKAAETASKHMKTLSEQATAETDMISKRNSNFKKNRGKRRNNFDQQICGRCGREKHGYNKYPAVGKECRECHKKNHFMKMCKSKEPTSERKKTN